MNLTITMKFKLITFLTALITTVGPAALALADEVAPVSDYRAPINYPNNAPHTKANYQNTFVAYSSTPGVQDPDLIHIDYPNNAPHTKANYKAPGTCACAKQDPDLVHDVAY